MRRQSKLESDYQAGLIERIRDRFPGCWVLKNDEQYQQGIPDLLILWHDMWAMLEVKRRRPTRASDYEPNQEWFLEEFDRMSYAACIYPENEEEVLDDLQQAFGISRAARIS